MHGEDLGHRLGLERPPARGHFEDHQPQRVDVGTLVEFLQRYLLGGAVVRRADKDPVLGQTVLSDQAREPEVGEKRLTLDRKSVV